MKIRNNQSMILLTLLAAGFSTYQIQAQSNLSPLFKIDADTSLSWFQNDNNTRGMTVNPKGSILVADRTPVDAVYLLDPITGEETGRLNTSAVSEGTFPINKVVATSFGRIYVSNLASASSTFKIYYYTNEDSEPITIYRESGVSARWGDDIAVAGTGSRTTIGVIGSENPDVMILTDRDGDGQFTSKIVTPSEPGMNAAYNISFDLNRNYVWMMQSTGAPAFPHQYETHTGINTNRLGFSTSNSGPIGIAQHNSRSLIAMGPGWNKENTSEMSADILDLDNSSFPIYTTGNLGADSGTNDNINGSGDAIIDADRNAVYFLVTNNSISGWKLPAN